MNSQETTMIKLGDKARDKHTGYQGVVTARVQYITGPDRLCLETLGNDGEVRQEYFDIDRIEPAD